MIPVFRPYMDEDEKREVLRVLDSRWWGLGPETEKFEGEFLNYPAVIPLKKLPFQRGPLRQEFDHFVLLYIIE